LFGFLCRPVGGGDGQDSELFSVRPDDANFRGVNLAVDACFLFLSDN